MSRLSLSRTDRLLFSIVLILAVLGALLAWLVMPPEKTGGIVRIPSTFYNAGYGAKAVYLALERLEYPTSRLRRPIDESTLKGIGVLFVLTPLVGLMDDETAALEEWVKAGHALVVAPGRPDDFDGAGSACQGGACTQRSANSIHDWFELEEVADESDENDSDGKVRVDLREKPSVPGWQPDRSDPLIAGIGPLVAAGRLRFSPTSPLCGSLGKLPSRVFWKDKSGTVGLSVEYGEGTIIALADTYPLTNLGIGDGDNGLLLGNVVRILSERYPGAVAFDEYHLGFPQRDWSPLAIAKLTFSGRWGWAMAQAALVGVMALFAGAVRFGSPRDIVLRKRRQHREFAEAAGRLLNDAGALPLAAETLYHYYRNRLCRLVHLEPEVDDQRLSQTVGDRSGYDIQSLLQQAGGAVSAPIARQRLLAIVQKLHQAVEALDHGT